MIAGLEPDPAARPTACRCPVCVGVVAGSPPDRAGPVCARCSTCFAARLRRPERPGCGGAGGWSVRWTAPRCVCPTARRTCRSTAAAAAYHGGTGYPMLRLVALICCGPRTLLDAVFASDRRTQTARRTATPGAAPRTHTTVSGKGPRRSWSTQRRGLREHRRGLEGLLGRRGLLQLRGPLRKIADCAPAPPTCARRRWPDPDVTRSARRSQRDGLVPLGPLIAWRFSVASTTAWATSVTR